MSGQDGAVIRDTLRRLGNADMVKIADILVTEWLRREWSGDDAEPGEVPGLMEARRQILATEAGIDFAGQNMEGALADQIRAALIGLDAIASHGSPLKEDILFAIDTRETAGEQSGARIVVALGFSIALILAVAKLEGPVGSPDFAPGVPANVEKLVQPLATAVAPIVTAAGSAIDKGKGREPRGTAQGSQGEKNAAAPADDPSTTGP